MEEVISFLTVLIVAVVIAGGIGTMYATGCVFGRAARQQNRKVTASWVRVLHRLPALWLALL